MNKAPPTNLFTQEASVCYDERNQKLSPISDNMHFLIRLILNDLPAKARVLCVGVGTGAEILSLSKAFPEWSFVGVDPSGPMIDVCRVRLQQAGVLNRCELLKGYVQDVPSGDKFDAALSILVAHFVKRDERTNFFTTMCNHLHTGGYLVNTEISFDLDSEEFPLMYKNWGKIQALMGATPESLVKLPELMRSVLSVLPPEESENILKQSGISTPVRFFQAFMITGWFGQKLESRNL